MQVNLNVFRERWVGVKGPAWSISSWPVVAWSHGNGRFVLTLNFHSPTRHTAQSSWEISPTAVHITAWVYFHWSLHSDICCLATNLSRPERHRFLHARLYFLHPWVFNYSTICISVTEESHRWTYFLTASDICCSKLIKSAGTTTDWLMEEE